MIHKWPTRTADYSGTDISGNYIDGGPNRSTSAPGSTWVRKVGILEHADRLDGRQPGARRDPRQRSPQHEERHVRGGTGIFDSFANQFSNTHGVSFRSSGGTLTTTAPIIVSPTRRQSNSSGEDTDTATARHVPVPVVGQLHPELAVLTPQLSFAAMARQVARALPAEEAVGIVPLGGHVQVQTFQPPALGRVGDGSIRTSEIHSLPAPLYQIWNRVCRSAVSLACTSKLNRCHCRPGFEALVIEQRLPIGRVRDGHVDRCSLPVVRHALGTQCGTIGLS